MSAPPTGFVVSTLPYLEWVASAVVVVGIAFGAWQFLDAKHTERVRQTLVLVDGFESDYRDDYRLLADRVGTFARSLSVENRRSFATTASPNRQARAWGRLYDDVLGDPEGLNAFDDIVFFFERLAICVRSGICDYEAARAFFDTTLLSFWNNFTRRIEQRRATEPRFAEATGELRNRFAGERAPQRPEPFAVEN